MDRHPQNLCCPMPSRVDLGKKVGSDLFHHKGQWFLLVVDYYSRFVEAVGMKTTDSNEVIEALKSIFARFGIPEMLVSDNGPQYAATQFKSFSEKYGFVHVTSSPKYPQSMEQLRGLFRQSNG